MANPRRTSNLQIQTHSSSSSSSENLHWPPPPPLPSGGAFSYALSSAALFFKRPSAFPFLLSVFILLTWIFLRLEHPPSSSSSSNSLRSSFSTAGDGGGGGPGGLRNLRGGDADADADADANMVRFSATEFPSKIARDRRGWMLNPVQAAESAGLYGGASDCRSVHLGQIRPGGMRGNHRHNTCNETFVIWGAETKFRLENADIKDKGYAEVIIGSDEVAVIASPRGTAHAILNVDPVKTAYLLGCQDNLHNQNGNTTDYNVWKDL